MTVIRAMRVLDVRFPTSTRLDGSDAMNPDPDYSAAYVVLASTHERALEIVPLQVLQEHAVDVPPDTADLAT